MGGSMTPAAKYELLRMNARARFPYLIKITNEDLGMFLYTNTDREIEYEGETYKPAYFEIVPPERSESSIGDSKLTISAIDGEWIAAIRSTQKRSTCRFIACIEYKGAGNVLVIEPIEDNEFLLTAAQWDDLTVSWTMIFDDNMNIMVPCDVANSLNFPGSV